MTFSIFDWLVISIRPRERPPADGAFPGLTQEEIRELKRMRAEVQAAREATKALIGLHRGGMV